MLPLLLEIIPATMNDYPTLQNMSQFYVYECSKECDFTLSKNGLYEPTDYKFFIESSDHEANIIKVRNEIAGFVLIEKTLANNATRIAQFFILSKFQRQGIGRKVVHQLLKNTPGKWSLAVLTENTRALSFWRKVISDFTRDTFKEEIKEIESDKIHPKRRVLSFDYDPKESVFSDKSPPTLHVDLSPSKEDDAIVLKGLQSFNQEITRTKEVHFSVFAKDSSGKIVGGALVYLGRDSAFLDILWVHLDYRNKGIGRSLLAKAEKQASKTPECKWIKLDTYSFQAPDFYLKCGYELYGEVKNFTKHDSKIFFRKALP